MEKHVHVLGILYIVFNALGLLLALILFWALIGPGIISGDAEAFAILTIIALVLWSILVIMSIPGIIGGIALLKRQSWARILVLILGFLNLLDIPFGTALGIYTIWVLMKDETIALFEAKKAPAPAVAA
jgi:hypothetical protein